MSDELNRRIAQELGWESVNDGWWAHPVEKLDWYADIPDWSGDLNLMHELEESLTDDEAIEFVDELNHMFYYSTWLAVHATAEQKAEAWLKVKELNSNRDLNRDRRNDIKILTPRQKNFHESNQ